MADRKEIVRQIADLVEALDRVVAEEQSLGRAEDREKITELSAGLEAACAREEEALAAKQELEREAEVSGRRIETLVQKLKEARQAAADAAEEAQKSLRRQLEALQEECDEARIELEQERGLRKKLEKAAAVSEKRLQELEKALAGTVSPDTAREAGSKELARLQVALDAALEAARQERETRGGAEAELAEAHKLITALEQAVKQSRSPGEGVAAGEARRLAAELQAAEVRAERTRREDEQQAAAFTRAEKRIRELEETLSNKGSERDRPEAVEAAEGGSLKPVSDKPLPHELRPAPRPGAVFRPDWDLQGLPCRSSDQVLEAWSSVFNVQLSLEGYPAQYCAAFLVVLKQGKAKQLYVMFNLKGSRHTLVCVPGKMPTDEASLNKAVAEGLKYLQMSGFELEKLAPAEVSRQLECYFVKP